MFIAESAPLILCLNMQEQSYMSLLITSAGRALMCHKTRQLNVKPKVSCVCVLFIFAYNSFALANIFQSTPTWPGSHLVPVQKTDTDKHCGQVSGLFVMCRLTHGELSLYKYIKILYKYRGYTLIYNTADRGSRVTSYTGTLWLIQTVIQVLPVKRVSQCKLAACE